MVVLLGFLIVGIDSCEIFLAKELNRTINFGSTSIDETDRFTEWRTKELNVSYNQFMEKYYSVLEKYIREDSMLLIHRYDNKSHFNQSIVVNLRDFTGWRFSYYRDSVLVCRLFAIEDSRSIHHLKTVASIRKNINHPHQEWSVRDGTVHLFLIDIATDSRRTIFQVSIEGLPREHFVNESIGLSNRYNELKESSEWRTIKGLFTLDSTRFSR